MGEGLKDLKTHLLDALPRQLATDTFAAFMDAGRQGGGKDWSEATNPGRGLEIDENGNMTFNGNKINQDAIGEIDESEKGDAKVSKGTKISRDEALKEAARIFENRGATNIEVTEEMLADVLGEDNGKLVWNQIVATSILDRIIIPNEPTGKKGEYKEKFRKTVGRGSELWKKKHMVAKSIMQSGDYYPGTSLGLSRSKDEKFRALDKDKGGANFAICIDVSTSNGHRGNVNSRLNAVLCLATALVTEARMLDYSVSLYVHPTCTPIPEGHPLTVPGKLPLEVLSDWRNPNSELKVTMEYPNIDPRFYYQHSKDYDQIVRDLTEAVDSNGYEVPAQVFPRLVYDLDQLPKKEKATVIWIADCTIPEFYLGIKNFYDTIRERGEFWIIQVGNEDTDIRDDMEAKFGTAQKPKIPGVRYAAMPDFSKPGMNPDTLPLAMAEALGLKKVKIKGTNGLRDFT